MILTGDCLDIMPTLPAESIDAIVTDPPYGLEFMGKEWDRLDWRDGGGFSKPGIGDRPTAWTSYGGETANPTCATCGGRKRGARKCACAAPDWRVRGEPMSDRSGERSLRMQDWHYRWAREALRVAKPGAHLLAFGGTRTYHRLACAIEDAGWEVRDCLVWAYASGFPKSLDVSKAMDKAAGAEREVVGPRVTGDGHIQNRRNGANDFGTFATKQDGIDMDTAPATDLARQWQGWGTALKPAWEPIILARKPLRGTVARNVAEYGTGALNIDGCRIATDDDLNGGAYSENATERDQMWGSGAGNSWRRGGAGEYQQPQGRWPANLILTDPLFDGDTPGVVGGGRTGIERGSTRGAGGQNGRYGPLNATGEVVGYGDSGTYSRFFLIPKASRSDREPRGATGDRANTHPTVKPTALMRHLVRLVTPPGGTVLDPFLGSGTTALACEMEGFDCIGIEREEEYARIVEARLALVQRGAGL